MPNSRRPDAPRLMLTTSAGTHSWLRMDAEMKALCACSIEGAEEARRFSSVFSYLLKFRLEGEEFPLPLANYGQYS